MINMVFRKRGAIDWTVGKLLSLILAVLLLVLITYGFSTGAITPLKERIMGQINNVLLMLGSIKGGGEGSSDCLEFSSSEIGGKKGGKVLLGNLSRIERKTSGLEFKICRDGTCSLEDSNIKEEGKPKVYDFEKLGEEFNKEGKVYSENLMRSYGLYTGANKLLEQENLEDVFDPLFNDIHVFYSWAYGAQDNLIYAIGWDDNWNVYRRAYLNENGEIEEGLFMKVSEGGGMKDVSLLNKSSTEKMLKLLESETDDYANFNNEVFYASLDYEESKNIDFNDFLTFRRTEENLISNNINYPSDNELAGNEDIEILSSWIEGNAKWQKEVYNPDLSGGDFDEGVHVIYSYAYDKVGVLPGGPVAYSTKPDDNLMYAIGGHNNWNVYAIIGDYSILILDKGSTEKMLDLFRENVEHGFENRDTIYYFSDNYSSLSYLDGENSRGILTDFFKDDYMPLSHDLPLFSWINFGDHDYRPLSYEIPFNLIKVGELYNFDSAPKAFDEGVAAKWLKINAKVPINMEEELFSKEDLSQIFESLEALIGKKIEFYGEEFTIDKIKGDEIKGNKIPLIFVSNDNEEVYVLGVEPPYGEEEIPLVVLTTRETAPGILKPLIPEGDYKGISEEEFKKKYADFLIYEFLEKNCD